MLTLWGIPPSGGAAGGAAHTTVVENPQEGQQGWHLIYFDSWQPPLWKVTADTALRNDKMTDWMDSLVEGLETTRGDGAQYVG